MSRFLVSSYLFLPPIHSFKLLQFIDIYMSSLPYFSSIVPYQRPSLCLPFLPALPFSNAFHPPSFILFDTSTLCPFSPNYYLAEQCQSHCNSEACRNEKAGNLFIDSLCSNRLACTRHDYRNDKA